MTNRDARERLAAKAHYEAHIAPSAAAMGLKPRPWSDLIEDVREHCCAHVRPIVAALLSDQPHPIEVGEGDQPWEGDSCPSECERGHIYNGPVCPACPMEPDQPLPSEQGALLPGWQPIETAPKDGTIILAGHETSVFDAYWDEREGGWADGATCGYDDDLITYSPTHWIPLPAPPSLPADGAAIASTTDASQASGTPNNPSNQTKGGE
jgi:hypothetical protein